MQALIEELGSFCVLWSWQLSVTLTGLFLRPSLNVVGKHSRISPEKKGIIFLRFFSPYLTIFQRVSSTESNQILSSCLAFFLFGNYSTPFFIMLNVVEEKTMNQFGRNGFIPFMVKTIIFWARTDSATAIRNG